MWPRGRRTRDPAGRGRKAEARSGGVLGARSPCGREGPDGAEPSGAAGAPDEERPRDGAAGTRPPDACAARQARADTAARREGRRLAKDAGAVMSGWGGRGRRCATAEERDGAGANERGGLSAVDACRGTMTTGCRHGGAHGVPPRHDRWDARDVDEVDTLRVFTGGVGALRQITIS